MKMSLMLLTFTIGLCCGIRVSFVLELMPVQKIFDAHYCAPFRERGSCLSAKRREQAVRFERERCSRTCSAEFIAGPAKKEVGKTYELGADSCGVSLKKLS